MNNFTKLLKDLTGSLILIFLLISVSVNAQLLNKKSNESYFKLKKIGEEEILNPQLKTKDSLEIYKKLNEREIKSYVKAGSEIRFKPFGPVFYKFNERKEVIILDYINGCFEIKSDEFQGYVQTDLIQTTIELLKLQDIKLEEEALKIKKQEIEKKKIEENNLLVKTKLNHIRKNDALPLLSIDNKGTLLSATGWLKNKSGQWISSKNKIPKDLGIDQDVLNNYEKYSLGNDNFISYELKDIKIKDSIYSIIIKKYKDGFYDYKLIEEGWNPRNSCVYYIISKSEMNKFKNIISETLNVIKLKIIYSDYILYIDPKTFTNYKLSQEINRKINEQLSQKIETANFRKQNEQILKTEFEKYGLEYKKFDDDSFLNVNISYFKNKNKVQFYFYDPMTKNDDVYCYYETYVDVFNEFIKLK